MNTYIRRKDREKYIIDNNSKTRKERQDYHLKLEQPKAYYK